MHHGFKHPEEMPVRTTKFRRKELRIKVLVFDIKSDKQIREHDVDFSKDANQTWLNNLLVWAFNNNKSVELFNIADDDE